MNRLEKNREPEVVFVSEKKQKESPPDHPYPGIWLTKRTTCRVPKAATHWHHKPKEPDIQYSTELY